MVRLICLGMTLLAFLPPARAEELAEDRWLRRVPEAHRAGDADALAEACAELSGNTWVVVEMLVQQGESSAAGALARAYGGPDATRLRAFAEEIQGRPPEPATRLRARIARIEELLATRPLEETLAYIASEREAAWPVTSASLGGLVAQILRDKGRILEAAEAYANAATAADGLGWATGAADAWRLAGGLYLVAGQPAKAAVAWARVLALLDGVATAALRTAIRTQLAAAKAQAGELEEARRLLGEAAELAGPLGDDALLAGVLHQTAVVHVEEGRHDEAEDLLARALRLARRSEDVLLASACLESLGIVAARRGGLEEAFARYRQALDHVSHDAVPEDILEQERFLAASVRLPVRIAGCLLALGQYALGLTCVEQAISMARHVERPLLLGDALLAVGRAQRLVGEWSKARAALEEARDLLARTADVRRQAHVWGHLGDVALEEGDAEEADRCYRKVAELASDLEDKHMVAEVMRAQAWRMLRQGDVESARQAAWVALSLHVRLREEPEIVPALVAFAEAQRRAGKGDTVEEMLEGARGLAEAMGLPDQAADLEQQIALLAIESGRPEDALAAARAGVQQVAGALGRLADEEGGALRDRWRPLFLCGMEAAAGLGRVEDLYALLEQARARTLLESLLERESVLAAPADEEREQARDQARASERRAAEALRVAHERGAREELRSRKADLDAAREARQALERRVHRDRMFGVDLAGVSEAPLADVRATLAADEALVLLGSSRSRSLALVVTREGARLAWLLETQDLLAAAARFSTDAPGAPWEEGRAALVQGLVTPLGLGPGIRRVSLSPFGLEFLPWSLLLPDRDVLLVPSATVHRLLQGQRDERGEGVLAFGDPRYPGEEVPDPIPVRDGFRLTPLPATRREAESVGSRVFLGEAATETAFLAALREPKRRRALHLACHGWIDEQRPLLSALALVPDGENDGFLSCLDLARQRVRADLVVLSACESGRGKTYLTEGVIGPVRAFLQAGAPRVLCSLWKVDDDATGALMERFYALWNPKEGPGIDAAAALRAAQAHVRAVPRWQHPYYWAAWTLWGVP